MLWGLRLRRVLPWLDWWEGPAALLEASEPAVWLPRACKPLESPSGGTAGRPSAQGRGVCLFAILSDHLLMLAS